MIAKNKLKKIVGWVTATISLLIITFWSYWGINEAFHEGWYHSSLSQNLLLTFIQYLSVPIIFITLSIVSFNFKKIGSILFVGLAVFSIFFFNSLSGRLLILIPLLIFAFGFYFGKFKHKKIFSYSLILIFLLIIFSFGIPQIIKVENRFNDYNFDSRIVVGNGVNLTWAPQGIGFPLEGTNWDIAKNNCARLNEEGTKLENATKHIWRLPSRDEIVRSMTRKNNNVLGTINEKGLAQYEKKPDKETPLWNPHSQVIYYWTNESKNEKQAFLVAYNGYILERNKNFGANYQGYRCVK